MALYDYNTGEEIPVQGSSERGPGPVQRSQAQERVPLDALVFDEYNMEVRTSAGDYVRLKGKRTTVSLPTGGGEGIDSLLRYFTYFEQFEGRLPAYQGGHVQRAGAGSGRVAAQLESLRRVLEENRDALPVNLYDLLFEPLSTLKGSTGRNLPPLSTSPATDAPTVRGTPEESSDDVPEWNRANALAFEQEREELLTNHSGWYAAYHEGQRIALEREEREIVDLVEHIAIAGGVVFVQRIVPKGKEECAFFDGPRP